MVFQLWELHTFNSLLSSTGNLPKYDLSFEWSEHYKAEFDW